MIWPHSCVTALQQQPNHTVKCLLVSTSVTVLHSPKAHIIIINAMELGKTFHSDERTPLFQDHFAGILCLSFPTQMIPWPGMLKGEPSRRRKLACKRTKHANMSIYGLHLLLLSTFLQKKYFFLKLQIRAPQGTAMLVCSSPMRSRKRLAHNIFNTFATHAQFIYCFCTWALFSSMFYWPVHVFCEMYWMFYLNDKP